MGIYDLLFRARLEGVAEVRAQADMRWFFRVQCSNCGEENDREIYLHGNEDVQDEGSRGSFNFIMKCKGCSKSVTLNLLHKSVSAYTDSENFQRIAQVDARGLRVLAWRTSQGLNAYCQSGRVFEDINVEEADWTEYDEEGALVVGIYEITTSVQAS